jgi:hypothetical protein
MRYIERGSYLSRFAQTSTKLLNPGGVEGSQGGEDGRGWRVVHLERA